MIQEELPPLVHAQQAELVENDKDRDAWKTPFKSSCGAGDADRKEEKTRNGATGSEQIPKLVRKSESPSSQRAKTVGTNGNGMEMGRRRARLDL